MMTDGDALEGLARWIESHAGIVIGSSELDSLARKLSQLIAKVGSAQKLLSNLVHDVSLQDAVIEAVTIGETYFFRNSAQFAALRNQILPELVKQKNRLGESSIRIWSAGCASGEEPYSIAITCKEVLDGTGIEPHIVGSDINRSALERARKGIYRKWSFRNVEQSVIDRYFEKLDDETYRLDDSIRNMVHFTWQNLANIPFAPQFSNFDVIFCRNVMIYFSRSLISRLIEEFHRVLNLDGVLMVGHSESFDSLEVFERVFTGDAFFYRKSSKEPKRTKDPDHELAEQSRGMRLRSISVPSSLRRVNELAGAHPKKMDEGGSVATEILSLIRKGRLDEAQGLVEKHAKDLSTNAEFYFAKALLAEQRQDWQEMLDNLHKALFLDSNCLMAQYLSAVVLDRLGNPSQAIRHYRNTLNLLSDGMIRKRLSKSADINPDELAEIVRNRLDELS